MKDIKSFIIGFLSCACLFLFMGATYILPDDDIGKYQAFDSDGTEVMIDTQTGKLYYYSSNYGWINRDKSNQWKPE